MKMIARHGGSFQLLFKNLDYMMPLPNSHLTTIHNKTNWIVSQFFDSTHEGATSGLSIAELGIQLHDTYP